MVHLRIQLKKRHFLNFYANLPGQYRLKNGEIVFLFAGTWYTGPNFFVDKLRIE
jgi:hypothetical protein